MQWLTDFAKWLLDILLFIPRWIWNESLQAIAALINAIPVPEFIQAWPQLAAAIPPQVVWFLNLLQVRQGLAIVVSACVLRFLIRRIPLVG